VAERGHVNGQRLHALGDAVNRPRQLGCFPQWKQKHQFRIGCRSHQQRDEFGLAVEPRI
jgi:hypothetical protein